MFHQHFNADNVIDFMQFNLYDNITIKSKLNDSYINIQVDKNNYEFEWVEHIPYPSKIDREYAQEYEVFLVNLPKKTIHVGTTQYKDDSWIMDKLEIET